ncbi:hypothetical protein DACRYDRAFT_17303 [Dacryopinax primogenitus]|uniref:T6SS Phospholipase effector Tle1-like catalytic domain-containing protein n=1 Tax=Dacryopinax primogenitus (strain DJM 731) TaxID=1858805 RepID=M5FU07_DACPD|nr:uncharacterized protein DACRYDRAFT_17303 [Dacryopinax primogenitus]EJT99648.1 hypothetical protein DACRYDRAFT_17303 [Dacryopinax primogenitus]
MPLLPSPPPSRTISDATSEDVKPTLTRPRRLILCFDGTSNLFDKENTNVVKLVSYLKKDDLNEQQVYYQEKTGVGTYIPPGTSMRFAVSMAKLVDQAVAWDIGNHIMGGYSFLMQNWTPGSKISIFGFSRGAYTARALAGMLHKAGLLSRSNEEQVPFAYKMYATGSDMCDGFKTTFCNPVEVDFLGVWDTVSSVGVLTKTDLPFTDSAQFIRVFRHAVSLDERRCKFKANLCELSCSRCMEIRMRNAKLSETEEDDIKSLECDEPHTDVEEVWFAGGHGETDVGGGCVTNGVAHSANRIPLVWMIREMVLSKTGIEFNTDALNRDGIKLPTPDARVHLVSKLDLRYAEDVKAPIHDWLNEDKRWWILELLPFTYRVLRKKEQKKKVKKSSKWRLSPWPNFGHYRNLPSENMKVHVSVLERRSNNPSYDFRWTKDPKWIQ